MTHDHPFEEEFDEDLEEFKRESREYKDEEWQL